METLQKAIFYGPLGNNKRFTVGGGEAGNLKTIYLLEKNRIKVIKVFKPYPEKSLIGYATYALKMIFKIFDLTRVMILNRNVKTVHISGFYQHLIYQEYFLILLSRIFNKKCIYELRGGGVTEAYRNSSFLYRVFFKKALNKASVILCQGKSYIPFLESLTQVKVIYYPNFILNEFSDFTLPGRQDDKTILHLVYFGRIVESKNIEFIVEACHKLSEMNVIFDMEIIGSGDSEYIDFIQGRIKDFDLEKNIRILPPMQSNSLKEKLITKHFFLFPSKEKREGHSNALTEAMAMGVVPVCSNAGFNREIVDFDKLIVDQYDSYAYANAVNDIWSKGDWKDLSKKVSQRIENNFTEKVAEKVILNIYKSNI